MGPDDFLKQNSQPPNRPNPMPPRQRQFSDFGRPQPQRPGQRPMQDFGPAQNPQGPMHNLRPHPQRPPMQSRPGVTDLRPPQQQQIPRPHHSAPHPQPTHHAHHAHQVPARPQHTQHQNQPAQTQTVFDPKAGLEKKKKGRKLFKKRNVIPVLIIAVLTIGYFVIAGSNAGKNEPTAKANPPSIKPFEQPEFTIYYPKTIPPGLTVAKGSITNYKDSFSFILQQDGQNRFFINEQPASTDPGLSSLKSRLLAPKDFSLSLGQGIAGSLDSGTVTAIKTDKDTIIIVNCVKATNCDEASKQIITNMQVTDDLDGLRKSNT